MWTKEKAIPVSIGVGLVCILAFFLFLSPFPLIKLFSFLENGFYDLQLRKTYHSLPEESPITIIDIDDASIQEEGRWPWNRKKMAELTKQLSQLGASVIAFDILFPEPEQNPAEQILSLMKNRPDADLKQTLVHLEEIKGQFDYDRLFAESLSKEEAILGFALKKTSEKSEGNLPPPFSTVSPEIASRLLIPSMPGYLGNVEILQKAAKGAGFINASPDFDGIIRSSPLILRREGEIFPCLALEAVRVFLKATEMKLLTVPSRDSLAIEGVQIENLKIPTDAWGRILIPFRGPPYSFPYLSATAVLKGQVPPDKVKGRLVFIGSSALSTGDLVTTAISPTFAGVEIHATIASGILDHYLPYKPSWAKGFSLSLVLLLGLFYAICLPYGGIIGSTLAYIPLPFFLVGLNRWIWMQYGVVLSMTAPILVVTALYILNLLCGYLFEVRKRQQMRSIFDQYIPPERIDLLMSQSQKNLGLEGESKELTVLFADIRNFTALAETLSASDLKDLLNFYFTPMTQVIFHHKGTIDKYVGDLIMAFWGAPLDDPNHALNGVKAALDMQAMLGEINQILQKEGKDPLRLGIGLNTGIMSVGDMGSKFRRAYTVLGDAVNLGARLESSTKYYQVDIIVSETTYQPTKSAFIYRKLDRVLVKGRQKAVEIYQPLDYLEENTSAKWKFLEKHEQALEAYFQKRWDEAKSLFQKLQEIDPSSQKLYEVYLSRIEQLRNSSLPADWDGVFRLESK